MRLRRLSILFVLVLGLSGLAAPSLAGPPGKWTVISGGGLTNIVEPGLFRTADGTLHVAMQRNASDFTVEYIDVAHITESGKLTGRTDATGAWEGVTVDPELVGSPDGGMRLVFGGIRTGDVNDPYTAGYLWQSSSPADGLSWLLSPTPAVAANTGYASSGSGATTLSVGTLVAAYPAGSTIYYQVGAGPALSFDVADCCAYDVTLVEDDGVVYAAWYANGDGAANMGQFVRTIYPTLGPIIQVPGSVSSFGGSPGSIANNQHAAMATRNGGGVYIAFCKGYPTCDSVVLWKYGTTKLLKVPQSQGASHVAISPAPSGRLWVVFEDDDDRLHAVRSNTTAKKFGAVRTLQRPKSAGSVYKIGIEGTRARADLLFNDSTRIWHQQLFAGLTLKALPDSWNGNQSEKIKFEVTDAGDPVQGATVKAKWAGNKLTCKTEADGRCSIKFPKMGKNKIKVAATKSGYAPDDIKLKVN